MTSLTSSVVCIAPRIAALAQLAINKAAAGRRNSFMLLYWVGFDVMMERQGEK